MVATRRGTRLSSPAKNTTDEASGTPASTSRRTRHRTVLIKPQSQSEQTSDSQQDEIEENTAPNESASSPKRVTRSSKCHPTEKQPESKHIADVSESESCCSVVLEIQPTPRGRRRATVQTKATAVDEQEASKADSSSLSLGKTPCRSTRGQRKPVRVLEATTSQEDEQSEAESSSSVASLSTRVTRSRRKPAVALEDAAHSEAESCSSVVSGPQGSTVRRSTRSRVKVTEPIPINLEQSKTTDTSAAFEPRRTRGRKGKAKSAEEDQAYDSEGCQSGPSFSPRRSTRRVADSDAESLFAADTPLDSPCSTRSRGTPCSSRTGSASSTRAVRVSRSKNARVALVHSEENEPEHDQAEITGNISATESDLEEIEEEANNKTVIAADHEGSIVENSSGDFTVTLHEGDAEVIEPECRKDISSEIEKDVECREIAQEAMETHVPAMEEESSSISVMSQMIVTEAEEGQSDLTEQPVTPVLQSCDKAKQEENSKVPAEPEEKVEATKEMMKADDGAIRVGQESSEESVMEVTADEEGPSSSTKVYKPSTEKNKPVRKCISLLDSSEEEESDNDGLSVDGGNDEAGDLESEDEVCCSEDQPGPSGTSNPITGNGLFVIDARPGCDPNEKYYTDTTPNDSTAVEDEEDFVDEEGDDDDEEDEDSKVLFTTRKPALTDLSSSIDPGLKVKALGGLYINFDGSKSKSVSNNLKKLKDEKNQNELLKKSLIVPDFEKKDSVPPYKESKHAAKLKRREERTKTTGDGWFNMRAPELTVELKNDLKALQMRSAMDPKRFYKKKDRDGFPKYFQVGTVVDNPIDFYHSRIPKKQRKRTIVEELLADAEFRSFNKRKYAEIMTEKATAAAGKMNKKKHKFHKKK